MIRLVTPVFFSRRSFRKLAVALTVVPALLSVARLHTAFAQGTRPGASADPGQRLSAVEREMTDLKAEVVAQRERLDALLGPSADPRPVKLTLGSSPARGNADAAITLVFFGDYQSVYSVRAYYVVKRLLEDYPNAIRVVYKQYPLPPTIHPQAQDAALAALAADRQGKFWELQDLLYQNSRRLDANLYAVLADQAGLNLAQFDRDRHSPEIQAKLAEDEQAAVQASVPGVPTLYLNGRALPQWRYDYVRAQIDALRKK
jgi:protein-disulfide isomerase